MLGHHPHVLQGFETLSARDGRTCLAAYSLGSFVFDQSHGRTPETIALQCALTSEGIAGATVSPMRIRRARPEPSYEADGYELLRRLTDLSAELGRDVRDEEIVVR